MKHDDDEHRAVEIAKTAFHEAAHVVVGRAVESSCLFDGIIVTLRDGVPWGKATSERFPGQCDMDALRKSDSPQKLLAAQTAAAAAGWIGETVFSITRSWAQVEALRYTGEKTRTFSDFYGFPKKVLLVNPDATEQEIENYYETGHYTALNIVCERWTHVLEIGSIAIGGRVTESQIKKVLSKDPGDPPAEVREIIEFWK